MQGIISTPPKAVLTKAFTTPFDNAVATARTCYSSRIINDDDVRKDEKAIALRDDIAQSTYVAGHHTTLQHAHFQFTFENVSRQALWAFFHAHPFYNSEQVSQRYVEVKAERVMIPRFSHDASQARYQTAVTRQMSTYRELLTLLHPAAEEAYFSVYKARLKNKDDKRWQSAIKKRCQEVARYVLPVGTHAHLYHTISGLTLHRYNRVAQSHDCPLEQKLIIQAMVDEVTRFDPLFFRKIEAVTPLENTHDDAILRSVAISTDTTASWIKDFDRALEGRTSRLVNATLNATQVMSTSLRHTFALSQAQLSDEQALEWLLHPGKNPYLGQSLNLNTLSKSSRALELVHFTFQKKISHSADSQAQRHRMIPGVCPLLWTHVVPGVADYITPSLFAHPLAEKARALFDAEMLTTFEDIAFLTDKKESPEAWQYLLPNSFPVRFVDTASLLDHHHKWSTRLCYNAQEEIWSACLDEVQQVNDLYPQIGRWLLPPCGLRAHSSATPVCPEGVRFCGTPVWRLKQSEYRRIL